MIIFIIAFLLILISSGVSYIDKYRDYKKGKLNSKGFIIIFIIAVLGGLLSLLSNINSSYEKEESSKQNKKLNDSLFHINDKLLTSQALNTQLLLAQKDSTNKIISINKNLFDINSNIQSLQNIIVKNITGDGNIPQLQIQPDVPGKDYYTLCFSIWNNGNTPLRGIKASIEDCYSEFFAADTMEFIKNAFNYDNYSETIKLRYKEVSIGDRPPDNGGISFYYPKIQKIHTHFSFVVHISWDNGSYSCIFDGIIQKNKMFPILKLRPALSNNVEINNPSFIKIFNNVN